MIIPALSLCISYCDLFSLAVQSIPESKRSLIPLRFYPHSESVEKLRRNRPLLQRCNPRMAKQRHSFIIFVSMNEAAIARGVKWAYSTGQLETNVNAVGIWDNYDKVPLFRTRCYIKD